MNQKKINSLYIHIPFCKNICPYCDFTKIIFNKKFSKQYVDQLLIDLQKVKENFFSFETIYIGGGTPSLLEYEDLERLLIKTSPLLNEKGEFTIEANPEDLNDEKLILFKKYGVNRISIGIQSFNKEILNKIHRNYEIDYKGLIKKVKNYISNINVDLIYGFDGQTEEELSEDIDQILKLNTNHISIYSLSVNPGTLFYIKKYKEQDDASSRRFYDLILKKLRDAGFERYEVSNFAKNKEYSKHNLNYRKNEKYVAIGIGASGYVGNIRYTNSKSLKRYLEGKRDIEKEEVSLQDKKEYFFLTNLRLANGFSLNEYENCFNSSFLVDYKDEISSLINDNLLIVNDRVYCSDEGIMLLDLVLLKLFK